LSDPSGSSLDGSHPGLPTIAAIEAAATGVTGTSNASGFGSLEAKVDTLDKTI